MSSEIAEKLSRQTRMIVSKFDGRVDSFRGRRDLLKMTMPLDEREADAYAREYFGDGEHEAVGIDGSMDFDERLQMILFYANATAYSCPFRVGEGGISFELSRASRKTKLHASAAVPLWQEDFTEIIERQLEIDLELEQSIERIPNAFMTLAELYLASKVVMEGAKIVFMDRPLSGTYSTLSRDARQLLRRGASNLHKRSFAGEEITTLDIMLAVWLGSPSMRLPTRSRYLAARIVRELAREGGSRSVGDLARVLHVGEGEISKGIRRIERWDKEHGGALLVDRSEGGPISLREGVKGFWERSVRVALAYARSVYDEGEHPLSASSDEWLTVLDVSTISFLILQYLCETAIEKGVLVIGIAKDTTASDIARSVLQFGIKYGVLELQAPRPRLNNDRSFLTLLSAMNTNLRTPWRTRGYDAAFSTIVWLGAKGGDRFVPARKVIMRENLFVRGFFQLRTLGRQIHSPVFLFDRVFSPAWDESETRELEITERGQAIIPEPYFEVNQSEVTNLTLRILSLCDNPEVFEALGHNQLLYLADKAVKAEIRLMKSSLRGVTNLSLGTMSKREQVYGIATSFREQRLEAEQNRMGSSGRGS